MLPLPKILDVWPSNVTQRRTHAALVSLNATPTKFDQKNRVTTNAGTVNEQNFLKTQCQSIILSVI